MAASANIYHLADDLLVQILKKLDGESLGRCLAVSRHLNFLVHRVDQLTIELPFNFQAKIDDADLNKIYITEPFRELPRGIKKSFQAIKHLRIGHLQLVVPMEETQTGSGMVLKWVCEFDGHRVENCVIVGASQVKARTAATTDDLERTKAAIRGDIQSCLYDRAVDVVGDVYARYCLVECVERGFPTLELGGVLESVTVVDAKSQGSLRIRRQHVQEFGDGVEKALREEVLVEDQESEISAMGDQDLEMDAMEEEPELEIDAMEQDHELEIPALQEHGLEMDGTGENPLGEGPIVEEELAVKMRMRAAHETLLDLPGG
ncbi:hypothetical protein AMTR_s00010p00185340 [Amborella trichopoda]|uniref:F-box domain-containing protein n=1 Tax=Amborella trichopoda TaxID=13333 RepID=W1NFG6_AMBTC|nr:hypothetical protein AMTR_s00010p00185340 [Amborella trichopoda]